MDKGFLFRRLSFLVPCVLKLNGKAHISLNNKHGIAALQDVYFNPFYWDALLKIPFQPKTVYDLGANFGLFSSLYRQVLVYQGHLINLPTFYLIEANLKLVERLKKNLKNLLPNIETTILYGVAGPKNDVAFETDYKNLLASKISLNKNTKKVPFIDFNLCPQADVIKIDIEGAESLLFENYFNWLKQAKAIIIEFHYEGIELKKNCDSLLSAGFELLINQLEDSGYRNQLWLRKVS